MEKKKLDKNIEANLFSANMAKVIAALNTLKEKGNIGYLPLLFDLLNSNPETEIENEITFLLENLKIEDAVPVIIEAIQNPGYANIRKKIIVACWENGLDYSKYFQVFVDLVIHEEWETGFEAFTVIENIENIPDKEITDIARDKIHEALKDAGEQKKYLLHEILTLIR